MQNALNAESSGANYPLSVHPSANCQRVGAMSVCLMQPQVENGGGNGRAKLTCSIMAALILACSACGGPPPLTAVHRTAIVDALKEKDLPAPQSIEMSDGGYVVLTYEQPTMIYVLVGPREFAETVLLTARNALATQEAFNRYRVTLNGPSPGPGLIRRVGTLRWNSGSATWETDPRR
ncbi:MAG TPA: hypothetical protein VNJ04_02585 [Gemmatimonadaceae bacterium]|nr:hypothetical protein [Gemmatimonadaceae bacterium]